MTPPKLYTNPATRECYTAYEWADILGIETISFRGRVRRNPRNPEVWFGEQKDRRKPRQLIINPLTGEKATITEWAQRLNLSWNGFETRLKKWGADNPETFEPFRNSLFDQPTEEEIRSDSCPNMRHELARRNGAKFLEHPQTGRTMLAAEWAEHYGVTLGEFYTAMRESGGNNEELFGCFEGRRRSA